MPQFKELPLEPSQLMLFGTSVEDAVPVESDVRGFSLVMDCLDYSVVERKRSELGCPSYPPKELTKVLVYAYSKGIRSSRRIEELLSFDVRFIWLAGGLKPDHNTIARFRKENWQELTGVFVESVRVCTEVGLVCLKVVATDGTKVAAAASRRSVRDGDRLERELAAVEAILREAEELDRAEDEDEASSGRKSAAQVEDLKELKTKIEAAKQRLKESDRKNAVMSELDSRVMRTGERNRPCYNVQASVDTESQVIVAMSVTQHEVDNGELPAMVEQVESNTGCSPEVTLADCGYVDEETLRWAAETDHDVLMPLKEHHREKVRNDLFASKCFLPDLDRDVLVCPAGRELTFKAISRTRATYRRYGAIGCQRCSFYQQCVKTGCGSRQVHVNVMASQRRAMQERLASEEGRRLFGQRSQSVEPVFGQLKSNRGFDRFLTWGLNGASAETALACIAHNVMKCMSKATALLFAAARRLTAIFSQALARHQNTVPQPSTGQAF
jgi:transposase